MDLLVSPPAPLQVDPTLAYVTRWFWRFDALAEAVGAPADEVRVLIAAGCGPGPIYARGQDGSWWSALFAAQGKHSAAPPEGAETWWSPGSAWDLRRALLNRRAGMSPAEAAVAAREHFVTRFAAALPRTEGAREAFADCWMAEPAVIAERARTEWGHWIQGAYGVCLKVFTAETCLAKESLAFAIKRPRQPGDAAARLEIAQSLAALILPFAPFERAAGTPGRIDDLLAAEGLGEERAYG